MSSNVFDYQSFFEQQFDAFLSAEQASDKTRVNYKSDVRNFLSYVLPQIQKTNIPLDGSPESLLRLISPEMIEGYKSSELSSGTPVSTINRRLSAIRMFFKFAEGQHWITSNPASGVSNINKTVTDTADLSELDGFRNHLIAQGVKQETADAMIADVDQFKTWLSTRP